MPLVGILEPLPQAEVGLAAHSHYCPLQERRKLVSRQWEEWIEGWEEFLHGEVGVGSGIGREGVDPGSGDLLWDSIPIPSPVLLSWNDASRLAGVDPRSRPIQEAEDFPDIRGRIFNLEETSLRFFEINAFEFMAKQTDYFVVPLSSSSGSSQDNSPGQSICVDTS